MPLVPVGRDSNANKHYAMPRNASEHRVISSINRAQVRTCFGEVSLHCLY